MCAAIAREIALPRDRSFNGVKVFSASPLERREHVMERASAWLGHNPDVELVDITLATSGAEPFECVSLVIAYWKG